MVVLSATANSGTEGRSNPEMIEIPAWTTEKGALVRRLISIVVLAARMLVSVLRRATAHEVVLCVTSPFTLPYSAILGARLPGAAAVLLIYDLYLEAPDQGSSNGLAGCRVNRGPADHDGGNGRRAGE